MPLDPDIRIERRPLFDKDKKRHYLYKVRHDKRSDGYEATLVLRFETKPQASTLVLDKQREKSTNPCKWVWSTVDSAQYRELPDPFLGNIKIEFYRGDYKSSGQNELLQTKKVDAGQQIRAARNAPSEPIDVAIERETACECPYCTAAWDLRDVRIHIIDRYPPNTNHGLNSAVHLDQTAKDGVTDYLKEWFGTMMGWPDTPQTIPNKSDQTHAVWLGHLAQAKNRVDVRWHDWQTGAAPTVANTDFHIYVCMFGAPGHQGNSWLTAAERQTANSLGAGREVGVARFRGGTNNWSFFCEVWPDQLEQLNQPTPNSLPEWLGPIILHELFHLKLDVRPVPLAGTISVDAGETHVTGNGTKFNSAIWDEGTDELRSADDTYTLGIVKEVATDKETLTLITPSPRKEQNIAVAVLHDNHHWGTRIATVPVGRGLDPSRTEMLRMKDHLTVSRPMRRQP